RAAGWGCARDHRGEPHGARSSARSLPRSPPALRLLRLRLPQPAPCSLFRRSQVQTTLSSSLGDCRDASRVPATTTVKYDVCDACGLGTLGDEFADLAGLRRLVAVESTQVRLHGRSRRNGVTLAVVDDLHEDVPC